MARLVLDTLMGRLISTIAKRCKSRALGYDTVGTFRSGSYRPETRERIGGPVVRVKTHSIHRLE